jgi:hypothetical protein
LWNAAKSNGWRLPVTILASADFSAMAMSPPGQYYANRMGTDPLWDDAL